MSRQPKTYRPQGGCHNCSRVFVLENYDEGNRYFCTLDAPKRPLSGSAAMDESRPAEVSLKEFWDAWQNWSEGREVAAWGKCCQWEQDDATEGERDVQRTEQP